MRQTKTPSGKCRGCYLDSICRPHSSNLDYYPDYFHIDPKGIDGLTGTFTPLHLWFILYLLIFSFLALPLFRYLVTQRGSQVLSQCAAFICRKQAMFLLVACAPALVRLTAIPYPIPLYFFLFYFLGFVLLSDERFMETISAHRRTSLGLAIMTSVLILYKRMTEAMPDAIPVFEGEGIETIIGASTWFWFMVFLGFSSKHLNSSSVFSRYLNKAAYPVYITHMTFIVILGFFVMKWNTYMGTKYSVINLVTWQERWRPTS